MLASRIQSPRKPVVGCFTDAEFSAMTPAERNAATQAWLDRAQKLEPGTTQNRDWRETCGQGPSFDLLSSLSGNDSEDFDPREAEPEPDTRRRAGDGEMAEASEVGATDDVAEDAAGIDTCIEAGQGHDQGLGYAAANPFHTHTKKTRGGLARGLGRNAWNTILAFTAPDDPDRDVLVASAQLGAGESKKIGEMVGLSPRRIRQIQDQKLKAALENFTSADLRAHRDDPITTEIVARRALSRAGRRPRRPALVLVPKMATQPKPPRPYKPRRPRLRFVDPAQIDMFDMAA